MANMRQSHYDVMQVCESGHMVTSSLRKTPEEGDRHCAQCGAKTICACRECGQEIRGDHYVPHVHLGEYWGDNTYSACSVPKFCTNCGEPFPWTRQKMKALEKFAAEAESLSDEDRESLRQNAPLIATDNPMLEVAALRIKKIIEKLRAEAVPAARNILTALATEAAKKLMGL